MTALTERLDARSAAPAPDPVEAFELRCWARARLWQAGEIDSLHDAVDELQASAVAWGLVESIGQDTVQANMAKAFAAVRDDLKLCPEPQQACGSVPKSTLDAADFVKRQGDPERLRRWLADHREHLPGILKHWRGRGT